jgi:hypothetical protein
VLTYCSLDWSSVASFATPLEAFGASWFPSICQHLNPSAQSGVSPESFDALSLSLLLRPPTTLLITLVYALRCTPEVCHVLLLGLLSLESSSAHPIALVHLSGATMSEFLHIHLFGLFFLDFLSFCGLHFINVIESSSLTLPIQKSQYFYTHVTQVWVACGLTWRMLYMTVDGNDLEVSEYTRYKWKGDTCIISKWWTTTLRVFL